jgi:N-acetylglucosaminyl-diphospho-decaprenol L-rhamnosyltransferase
MSLPPTPLATIVVLNHNGRQWLEGCLEALLAQDVPDVEILLVDYASTDESATLVASRFPQVRILPLDRNAGFAGGNNSGARLARGRFLGFVNNDTRAHPDWLRALVAALEASPHAALAASRIVYMAEPDRLDSAGDGYLRCGGAYKRLHGRPASLAPAAGPVFGACGAAFLIRRDVFEELGGFDEDFFMVYEDVDLSYRARLLGYDCVYVPDAVVEHAGSATLGRASPRAVYFGQRNLEWTWIKNTPWPLLVRSAPAHLLYGVAAGVRYGAAGLLGPFVRGKLAAVGGLSRMARKRAQVQRRRRVRSGALWRMMDPRWIAIKRAEKRFDL